VDNGYDAIVTIGAYGEFFECFDVIAPMLVKMLLDVPSLWAAVSQSPVKWFHLAMKLRSSDVFHDAYRHMIARAYWHENKLVHRYEERVTPVPLDLYDSLLWADVADATGITEKELQEAYNEPMAAVVREMQQLEKDLIRLQLVPAPNLYYHRHNTSISFLNALGLRAKNPKRSNGSKINDKSEYIARTTYGNWVVQLLYGEVVEYKPGGSPMKGIGSVLSTEFAIWLPADIRSQTSESGRPQARTGCFQREPCQALWSRLSRLARSHLHPWQALQPPKANPRPLGRRHQGGRRVYQVGFPGAPQDCSRS